MSLTSIEKYKLARKALHTAMEREYDTAISYFDKELDRSFNEILMQDPVERESKRELFDFLIDCCREFSMDEMTSKRAKDRMLSLL